jgi:hypothetical protein
MTNKELRIIEIDTKVRYLPLLSQILNKLGNQTIPLALLKTQMMEWSKIEENANEVYNTHNGKLTENGEVTGAFEKYVKFLQKIGFIIIINEAIRCSIFGRIFNELQKENINGVPFENMFFAYFIFSYDADNLCLLMDMIYSSKEQLTQIDFRNQYIPEIFERLQVKEKNIQSEAHKKQLNDKLWQVRQAIERQKPNENISKQHKHLIPPRLEWLCDWGFIKKEAKGVYHFTEKGSYFYQNLPIIAETSMRDVSQSWLETSVFKQLASFFHIDSNIYSSESITKQYALLAEKILAYHHQLNGDGVMRVAWYPSLVYVIFSLLIDNKLIADFEDIENTLKTGDSFQGKKFILHKNPRINESYIIIKSDNL